MYCISPVVLYILYQSFYVLRVHQQSYDLMTVILSFAVRSTPMSQSYSGTSSFPNTQ